MVLKKIKEYLGNGRRVTRLVKFYAQEWGNEDTPLAQSPLESLLNTTEIPFIPEEIDTHLGIGTIDEYTIKKLIKEYKI